MEIFLLIFFFIKKKIEKLKTELGFSIANRVNIWVHQQIVLVLVGTVLVGLVHLTLNIEF